jgi:hypothetical protein
MKEVLEKELNLESIKEIFILANIPMYIYKHFKEDSSIQFLSKKYSTNEFIDFYNKLTENEITELDDIVIIYSILMAISFKNYNEINQFFEDIKPIEIRWFNKLKEIIQSLAIPSETYTENLGYKNSPNIIVSLGRAG